MLTTASLVAIPKADGGERPIAMAGGLAKVVGGVLKEICKQRGLLKRLCRQFLGVADGSVVLVHSVRSVLTQGTEDYIVIQLDVSNAFNELDRSALVEAVRARDSEMVGGVKALYGSHGKLLFATDKGEVLSIPSATGVRQGDPAAMMLYAVGVQSSVDRARARFPGVCIGPMADDTTVVGPCEQAAEAAPRLADERTENWVRPHASKTTVLGAPGLLRDTLGALR